MSIQEAQSRHPIGRCAVEQQERSARRSEIRLPVRLLGSLVTTSGVPACAQVEDLSRGGARCQLAAPPPIGSQVELRVEGLVVQAIVCWTAGPRCGLQFLRPIRATDILIQVSRSRPGAETGPERIRFPSPPLVNRIG
jgi:hypothetical protein